jgi:hypothetical protein
MAYDIFQGQTKRDWSCGSMLLPVKQQKALFNKIDDIRFDIRRSSNIVKIGLLSLSAAIALVAISNLAKTSTEARRLNHRPL